MAHSQYYKNHGPFSLKQILDSCESSLRVEGLTSQALDALRVTDVGSAKSAEKSCLCLCIHPSYVPELHNSQASFCVVSEALAPSVPKSMLALISSRPQRDFATICYLFYPEGAFIPIETQASLIHPEAQIDRSACLAPGVCVSKGAVIGKDVRIGSYSVIGPGVYIGSGCHIGPHVSLYYTRLGTQVFVGPGSRIGQEGFGFLVDGQGHVPLPQIGGVVIEDGVHIGANVTIDRGSLDDTVIGKGTRIDNLVQIAHNVVIGQGCVIVAQVGIAGSNELGNGVMIGGQAGLAPHLKIGSGVQIAAQSGVMHNIEPKEVVSGSPSLPIQEWRKLNVLLRRFVRTGSFFKKER